MREYLPGIEQQEHRNNLADPLVLGGFALSKLEIELFVAELQGDFVLSDEDQARLPGADPRMFTDSAVAEQNQMDQLRAQDNEIAQYVFASMIMRQNLERALFEEANIVDLEAKKSKKKAVNKAKVSAARTSKKFSLFQAA